MNKQKLIIGNLKMNLESVTMREAYLTDARTWYKALPKDVHVVICPPMAHLERFGDALDDLPVTLGAQDCFWELHGRYTGQVSARSIADFGGTHVILGHSERRALGETDDIISKKVNTALRTGLIPVVCVGYAPDGSESVALEEQTHIVFEQCKSEDRQKIVIAYEPVWAIGTGKTPTAQEIHTNILIIRRAITRIDPDCAKNIQVLYGGSVKPENVHELCTNAHADGVLVGGVSLRPEEFTRIVKYLYNKNN